MFVVEARHLWQSGIAGWTQTRKRLSHCFLSRHHVCFSDHTRVLSFVHWDYSNRREAGPLPSFSLPLFHSHSWAQRVNFLKYKVHPNSRLPKTSCNPGSHSHSVFLPHPLPRGLTSPCSATCCLTPKGFMPVASRCPTSLECPLPGVSYLHRPETPSPPSALSPNAISSLKLSWPPGTDLKEALWSCTHDT